MMKLKLIRPAHVLLALIVLSFLAPFADTFFYAKYVASQGGAGLISLFNPAHILKYLLTPAAVILRVVLFSPLIFVLFTSFPEEAPPSDA